MEDGCLGYPGDSTVVSQPPEGQLKAWQISTIKPWAPHTTDHIDLVGGKARKWNKERPEGENLEKKILYFPLL